MDDNEQGKMRYCFFDEYRTRIGSGYSGIGGKIWRLGNKIEAKARKWDKEGEFFAQFGLCIVTPLLLVAAIFLAPPIGLSALALIGSAFAFGVHADKEIKKLALQEINRDTESGALIARYKMEVLDPEVQALEKRLEEKKANLPSAGAASKCFSGAVDQKTAQVPALTKSSIEKLNP
jgi:hypothetical protein